MRTAPLLALVLLLLAAGCEALTGQKTSDVDLEERIVDTPRLRELSKNQGKPTMLIDVRTSEQYVKGHLPGAVNIPLPQIRAGDDRLAEANGLIVYDAGWTDILAVAAAKKLINLKYNNIYIYRGGVELWHKQEGRELVEGTETGTLR